MSLFDKIKFSFKESRPELFSSLVEGYFQRCPDAHIGDVLPYLVQKGILLYRRMPSVTDLSALREYVELHSSNLEEMAVLDVLDHVIHKRRTVNKNALLEYPESHRLQILRSLLDSLPALQNDTKKNLEKIATDLGLKHECLDDLVASELSKRQTHNADVVSKAGLLVAFSIIIILLLLAFFMKPVFFGFLAAYLALPLERLFEEKVLQSRFIIALNHFFYTIFGRPIDFLKGIFLRRADVLKKKEKTPEEKKRRELRSLTMKASGLTLLTCIVIVIAVVSLATYLLVPFLRTQGANIQHLIDQDDVAFVGNANEKAVPFGQNDSGSSVEKKDVVKEKDGDQQPFRSHLKIMLNNLREDLSNVDWIKERLQDEDFLANGKDVVLSLFKGLSNLGNMLFDIIVFLASFFLFLQKMAFFRIRKNDHSKDEKKTIAAEISSWGVQIIFNSKWMPDIGEESRANAIHIFTDILTMFDAWIKGYFKIIAIEICLYIPVFLLFGVPYAIPLACISCMTVLLPVIGITSCVAITTLVTILFAPPQGLITALIGVALAYLLINGVLEQLILYPSLVGESLGLTALETIFMVLVGAAVAGITGMILAVPVAALLKYLAPICYSVLSTGTKKVTS